MAKIYAIGIEHPNGDLTTYNNDDVMLAWNKLEDAKAELKTFEGKLSQEDEVITRPNGIRMFVFDLDTKDATKVTRQ